MKKFILTILILLLCSPAFGATKYFMDGGVDNDWSGDDNWSTTSSAGPNNTTHAVDGDDVILDAGSPNCTVDAASQCDSLTCTGYTNTLTLSAGLTLGGNVVFVNTMTFTHNNNTITLDATGNFTPSTMDFYSITQSGAITTTIVSAGELDVYGVLTLAAGSEIAGSGATINLWGSSGTLISMNGGTVSVKNIDTEGTSVNSQTVTWDAGQYDIATNGRWRFASQATDVTHSLQGAISSNAPTTANIEVFATGGNNVIFTTNNNNVDFGDGNYRFGVAAVGGSGVHNWGTSTMTFNSLDQANNAGAHTLNIGAGTVNIGSIDFDDGTGSVTLSDTGGTWNISGSVSIDAGGESFYSFVDNDDGSTLSFVNGTTIAVSNNLDLQGSYGSPLRLQSNSSGNTWLINWTGSTSTIRYVNVQDSDASGGDEIDATDSTNGDLGNNTNWLFGIPKLIFCE